MPGKLKSFSTLFAFTLLVAVTSSARAQENRTANPPKKVPTLPCCKCLGGSNQLNLSTISPNQWIVNGNPAVFLNVIHPLWNINPGPAKWVSTIASGGTGNVPAGSYVYQLDFVVPSCVIEQKVSLTGNYGGDDDVSIFLDNTLLSQCNGGWCFNIQHKLNVPTFSALIASGAHALVVKVQNSGGPSGMFVNANLVSACSN
ncbi:MAG TPA: hypothetical protein VI306_02545 [Pyrinomonadaceae bacterium]